MATRRRAARAPRRAARRNGGIGLPTVRIPPEVLRSLIGLTLLAVGAITLVMLFLPSEQGTLTNWARSLIAPYFGSGRWLLPIFLLAAGGFIEWRPLGSDWKVRLLASFVAYTAFLGVLEFVPVRGGGRIGHGLADVLSNLLTRPGAFVVLSSIMIGGILVTANARLSELVRLLGRPLRTAATAVTTPDEHQPRSPDTLVRRESTIKVPEGVASELGAVPDARAGRLTPRSTSPAPMSQTIWSGLGEGAIRGATPGVGPNGSIASLATLPAEPSTTVESVAWTLPAPEILEQRPAIRSGGGMDHAANILDIEDKLRSFGIDAQVVGTNTGPVVTQYEVRPKAHVKLSRIEGLQDDLAMALAARSIRIEAPIPGKDVVGIEIPNVQSEVVGFRALIEDADMLAATSPLTFALGRDVSGKAYAVDLAKMPHLLVAGATGSGKSVCVNALITSILMHARPHEVRLLLVDLKRVELAPYDNLPHLLQHVIVEAYEAKAVLNWAVHEMEERYIRLAENTVRNITAYNEKVELADRMPFIVLVIDELADLIMREGRKVEDPVVKIAQKARAVGIHLVLATQRPSVNVVTGLIKANVPSRIAFAMSSNIDSRTVLDAPGAEDLIGRGDMLYQPVDLPRPVRLQGVFVSDREVAAVTEHWRSQSPEPFYDESIFNYVDGDENGSGGGQFGWLGKMAEDDLLVKAAELVQASQKASTSMLQTKLKVGFSRASRLMDELERYGVIGPQDLRNPAVPRIVFGPDNWLRSHADVDDPGD